jgi:manganese/zinc/iron transport system permease protein
MIQLLPLALFDLTWDATLRNVILGSVILGLTSGMVGAFAVLRRQSLIGDALAHAALPGICLAFILTGTRSTEVLLLGGAISGVLGTAVLLLINRWSIVSIETGLGIVLSVFFGLGILLLTRIQHSGDAAQSGLDRFIFGQAATILPRDVAVMSAVAVIVIGVLIATFKELKLLTFDPLFAASIGISPSLAGALLAGLLVLTVMIGLQTVGVILMVSLLIAPAVAARQWTTSLAGMVMLSGAFGLVAGVSGAVASSLIDRLPTGPMIVIAVSIIVAISLLFAPDRGVLVTWRARRRRSRKFQAILIAADHHGVTSR